MTVAETGAIMDILVTAYPRFYAGQDAPDPKKTLELWAAMFEPYPVQIVAAAVKALIATDSKGFPPHIGAVMEKVRKLTEPEETTEMEAWALVRKAIHGASMDLSSRIYCSGQLDPRTSAQRNFDALPDALKAVVHSPEQLAEWERLGDAEIDTVLQSNFMRSYRAKAQSIREWKALPEDVQKIALEAGAGLSLEAQTRKRLGDGADD